MQLIHPHKFQASTSLSPSRPWRSISLRSPPRSPFNGPDNHRAPCVLLQTRKLQVFGGERSPLPLLRRMIHSRLAQTLSQQLLSSQLWWLLAWWRTPLRLGSSSTAKRQPVSGIRENITRDLQSFGKILGWIQNNVGNGFNTLEFATSELISAGNSYFKIEFCSRDAAAWCSVRMSIFCQPFSNIPSFYTAAEKRKSN